MTDASRVRSAAFALSVFGDDRDFAASEAGKSGHRKPRSSTGMGAGGWVEIPIVGRKALQHKTSNSTPDPDNEIW